jgi:hypothetical protein
MRIEQQSLFDIGTPHARNTDPPTSRASAVLIEQVEGTTEVVRAGTAKADALLAFLRFGRLTAHDVERRTGRKGIWKRVSDLKNARYIEACDTRWDPETKRTVEVYSITAQGRVVADNLL